MITFAGKSAHVLKVILAEADGALQSQQFSPAHESLVRSAIRAKVARDRSKRIDRGVGVGGIAEIEQISAPGILLEVRA